MDEEQGNQVEVTYKFYLPEHLEELKEFQNAREYSITLNEIYNVCRSVLKYEEEPSDDRAKLAEQIISLIAESNVLDD